MGHVKRQVKRIDTLRINQGRLIRDELESRGIRPAHKSGEELFYHCPLPGYEDYTPRFVVDTKSNWWQCGGCHRSGSVINLVMILDSADFKKAARYLERILDKQARQDEIGE